MVVDLLRLSVHRRRMRAVVMQMLPGAGNVVLAAFLGLNNLARRFDDVNFTNVLDESLDVWQRWLVALGTDAIAPQAVINDRLALAVECREVFLDATDALRDGVFQSIARILKLVVALVPSALENLQRKIFRIKTRITVQLNAEHKMNC